MSFFIPAIISSALISLLVSLYGPFVVNRKTSLMGESISHALIPGVSLGIFFGGFKFSSIFLGAFAFLIIYSLLFNLFRRKFSHVEDSLFAVFQVGLLSLGSILMFQLDLNLNFTHILLGNMFSVSYEDLVWISLIAMLLLVSFFALESQLLSYQFDSAFYKAKLNKDALIKFFFDISLGVVLILSLQSLGALLSLGLLIMPSLISMQFAKSIKQVYGVSFLISFVCCLLGLLISYETGWPVGPAIMILVFSLFIIFSALFWKRKL